MGYEIRGSNTNTLEALHIWTHRFDIREGIEEVKTVY